MVLQPYRHKPSQKPVIKGQVLPIAAHEGDWGRNACTDTEAGIFALSEQAGRSNQQAHVCQDVLNKISSFVLPVMWLCFEKAKTHKRKVLLERATPPRRVHGALAKAH